MRPIRLELEGFTAYRELTLCDFEGVDLFVLTGPTGSGKSSLIDALTFALYGSVSRYGNPNLVHPVISQGKLEARVRFDFSVEGQEYTAVRIVRRTRTGATTKEARLESRGKTLAGNADEVTARVREILGLDFTQFTTCVVLPQGEFARFLHDTPSDRQDLLTKLLGVGVYEKMGNLARIREAEAAQKAALHREELERMDASEESKKTVKARLRELEALKKEIEAKEPELEALRERALELGKEAEKLEKEMRLLEAVPAPTNAALLSKKIESAREELARARSERAAAEETLLAAEELLARLPDANVLAELRESRKRLSAAARESEAALSTLAKNEEARVSAADEERKARDLLEEARRKLVAHDLRDHLVKGESCPVCHALVEKIPKEARPPALAGAEKAAAKAAKEKSRADDEWQEASKTAARASERLRGIEREIEALETKLKQPRSDAEIASELESIASARSSERARAERGSGSRARRRLGRRRRQRSSPRKSGARSDDSRKRATAWPPLDLPLRTGRTC